MSGDPIPSQYVVVRKIRLGKGSYGTVEEIIPRLVNQAASLGADGIINFDGSQRFGFWPWRVVRPVVSGTAVKWAHNVTVDCVAVGGTVHVPVPGSTP